MPLPSDRLYTLPQQIRLYRTFDVAEIAVSSLYHNHSTGQYARSI
jgi:hypothetical protein